MQNIILLFHGIAKTITAELIYIESIDNKHKNKPKNIINLKKTLIIHNTKRCAEVIIKSNIDFITFSKRNKKKMLFNLIKKNNKNLLLGSNIKPSIQEFYYHFHQGEMKEIKFYNFYKQ